MNAENPAQIEYSYYPYRTTRGGDWVFDEFFIRSSFRDNVPPHRRFRSLSFRLVRNK